ncbi:MAG: hypothetical protein AAF394_08145 [Planctomycetota bacterium]
MLVNAPLDFRLKSLSAEHEFFKRHELKSKTVERFGLGYCLRGTLKGRIAAPLHDTTGNLIGYAGRVTEDDSDDGGTPKYDFPTNREHEDVRHVFDREELLYQGHRFHGQPPVNRLVVVSELMDVWTLWQEGIEAVATMIDGVSTNQVKLIEQFTQEDGIVLIASGAHQDGFRRDALVRLSRIRACRSLDLTDRPRWLVL